MKKFAELFLTLEQASQDIDKIEILREYFMNTPAEDAAWALFLLLVWKSVPLVNSQRLKEWATEAVDIPDWLFQKSYEAVGDLEETIALLFPNFKSLSPQSLQVWAEKRLLTLRSKSDSEKHRAVLNDWKEMDSSQRLIWNKLLSGEFQSPVTRDLVITTLVKTYDIDEQLMIKRLSLPWEPTVEFYQQLISQDTRDVSENHSSGN